MGTLQIMALQEKIRKQLQEQSDDLAKEIHVGCEATDSTETLCGKMVANAITISVRISIGAVLDILIDAGLIEPYSDDEIRRKKLSIVRQNNE